MSKPIDCMEAITQQIEHERDWCQYTTERQNNSGGYIYVCACSVTNPRVQPGTEPCLKEDWGRCPHNYYRWVAAITVLTQKKE